MGLQTLRNYRVPAHQKICIRFWPELESCVASLGGQGAARTWHGKPSRSKCGFFAFKCKFDAASQCLRRRCEESQRAQHNHEDTGRP